jgi:hypothetical protein
MARRANRGARRRFRHFGMSLARPHGDRPNREKGARQERPLSKNQSTTDRRIPERRGPSSLLLEASAGGWR